MKNKKLLTAICVLFVSIIVIVGASYAYFDLNRVYGGNTVDTTTSELKIEYDDGPTIQLSNLLPGGTIIKEFSVKNSGSVALSYDILINDVINQLSRKSDLLYTLKKNNDIIDTNKEFFSSDDNLISNMIVMPNETHNFQLIIEYKNLSEDQSIDMGSIVSGILSLKVNNSIFNINGIAVDNEGNLINDGTIEIHSDVITSQIENGRFSFEGVKSGHHTLTIKNTNGDIVATKKVYLNYGEDNEVQGNKIYSNSSDVFLKVTANSSNDIAVTINKVADYPLGYTWEFDYTGGEQTLEIPGAGVYKIEVWGAQGGDTINNNFGGKGGYASGNILLLGDETLYINNGGQGIFAGPNKVIAGGYNGGGAINKTWGDGNENRSSGGGATHVALQSGLLSTLNENIDDIIIVAAGGGGATSNSKIPSESWAKGGNGGGYIGGTGTGISYKIDCSVYGSTQTATGVMIKPSNECIYNAGSFGQGGSTINGNGSGGGGGFYGGPAALRGSGGGSGYIGNSDLYDKVMYCLDCQESNEVDTKTVSTTCNNASPVENCSKSGNGYTKITLVSYF